MKQLVKVMTWVSVAVTILFVALLFTKDPPILGEKRAKVSVATGDTTTTASVGNGGTTTTVKDGAGSPTTAPAAGGADGAALYKSNCASCHGGKGQGGFGTPLNNGKVVKSYPNAADEVRDVTKGFGSMPSFNGDLKPEEIQAVVDFTRTLP